MPEPITVCIAVDEQGAISVGTEAPEAEEAAPAPGGMTDLSQPQPGDTETGETDEGANMQPAGSIDEALSMARKMLRAATMGGGATIGGEPGGDGAQSSADAAFKARRGYKAGM